MKKRFSGNDSRFLSGGPDKCTGKERSDKQPLRAGSDGYLPRWRCRVPCRQAVDGVRSCLSFNALHGAAINLHRGGQAWRDRAGLGGWPRDHVVGGPGGLVGGGGQGPPLEPGVLTHQRGALRRRGRRQVSQRWRKRKRLVSVAGWDLGRREVLKLGGITRVRTTRACDRWRATNRKRLLITFRMKAPPPSTRYLGCGSLSRCIVGAGCPLLQQVQSGGYWGQLGHRRRGPLHLIKVKRSVIKAV